MKDPIFEANPKLEKYYKTADGNAFFTEHDAKNYAISLKSKKVETVERPFVEEKVKAAPTGDTGTKETGKKLTPFEKAKLRIDAIEKLETVEDVEKALKDEKAKTVIAAGKKRIEVIVEKQKVATQEDVDDTNVDNATQEELDLFVKDNAIDLQGATDVEAVKKIVKEYIANPNKEIVPFKGDLN